MSELMIDGEVIADIDEQSAMVLKALAMRCGRGWLDSSMIFERPEVRQVGASYFARSSLVEETFQADETVAIKLRFAARASKIRRADR